jgi:sugar phosphate isomerase/epimerase
MKLTRDTIFMGLTDRNEKDKLFSRALEYNVELGLFCLPAILNGPWRAVASQIKKVFKTYPVKRHLHGPFYGLEYACKDPEVNALAAKKIKRVITAAGILGAEHVVVHSTYDPLNPDQHYKDEWMQRSVAFWQQIVPFAQKKNCMLVIENIYDETPDTIVEIINQVDSPFFKGCLDVGHANIFGTISLEEWVERFKKDLFHLHLHDNSGKTDEHLALGSGTVDFPAFFNALERVRHVPACTIEVLNEDEFNKSIEFLKSHNLLEA